MAGRRKGPCEFCDGTHDAEYKVLRNGFCIWLEVYPESNNLAFIAQSNDENGDMQEDYINVQMNYCPVCGMKWEV